MKMNLLIVSDGDSKYGSANSLYGLVSNLKKTHNELEITVVLTMNSEKENDYKKIGCNAVRIPYSFYYRTSSYESWKRPLSYVKHLPEYYYGRINALRLLERKIKIEEFDIIHTNTQREDLSLEIARKYKIPLVMHIREFGDLDYKSFSYRRNYISLLNQSVDKFIAISDIVKKHWSKKGIDDSKIVRIYNGVDDNPDYKTDYPLKQGEIIKIVIMGAILENKCHHILINALAKLNAHMRALISVDIIGDSANSYGDKLKKLVDELGLTGKVNFLGYITKPSRLLKNYDCGIMCSRSEAFGRVTAEYMMAGLCVIAANTGANPEIITDKVNGLIFEEGSDHDLTDSLEYIISNRQYIKEYGEKARAEALDRFTTGENAKNIYSLYQEVLTEHAPDGID